MINKQNNIRVKEATKVKNLRHNPSRAGNKVNIYDIATNISEISPLDETTPRVRLFLLQKQRSGFITRY